MTPPQESRLIEEFARMQQHMVEHERNDEARFSSLEQTLSGIGGPKDTPVLAVRLDRLETAQKDRSRLMWAVLAVALAILGERMAAHFSAKDPVAPVKNGP